MPDAETVRKSRMSCSRKHTVKTTQLHEVLQPLEHGIVNVSPHKLWECNEAVNGVLDVTTLNTLVDGYLVHHVEVQVRCLRLLSEAIIFLL